MTRVAPVGAGVVGASWSPVFPHAGFEVAIYDVDAAAAAAERAVEFACEALAGLAAQGVPMAEAIARRITPTALLEDALAGRRLRPGKRARARRGARCVAAPGWPLSRYGRRGGVERCPDLDNGTQE